MTFDPKKHDELMAEWCERVDDGAAETVVREIIGYIEEELVPVRKCKNCGNVGVNAGTAGGKLPSERAVEIYKEVHRLPEWNARELLEEHATIWKVLDERLGRAP